MSKMGNWIFEMQENVDIAVMNGCKTIPDVVNYVHSMQDGWIDDKFVREYATTLLGYVNDEGTSPGQAIYITNTQNEVDFDNIPF